MTNPYPFINISTVNAGANDGWVVVTAAGETVYIPNDPAGRFWQDIQDWIDAGGIVGPEI